MEGHGNRAHAVLSASGSKRWLSCTPSAQLEAKLPNTSSVFAQEGTLAHELAELELRHRLHLVTTHHYRKELAKIKKKELYGNDMPEQVGKYVTYCLEQITDTTAYSIEEKLNFPSIVPGGFGTADWLRITGSILEICDLKYGRGVRVEAAENPQLMIYGLGGLIRYSWLYEIETVKLTVVQPRLNHFSTWEISVEDLTAWAENVVAPAAAKAHAGEGEYIPGDHCKFCKAAPTCRALADSLLEVARHEFADPNQLTTLEMVEIFEKIPQLAKWGKQVADHLTALALRGQDVPGYKIVQATTRRSWRDDKVVVKALREFGLKPSQYINRKLKAISDVSSEMAKDDAEKVLTPLVVRPEGGPVLAPISDKREAWGLPQAIKDFS